MYTHLHIYCLDTWILEPVFGNCQMSNYGIFSLLCMCVFLNVIYIILLCFQSLCTAIFLSSLFKFILLHKSRWYVFLQLHCSGLDDDDLETGLTEVPDDHASPTEPGQFQTLTIQYNAKKGSECIMIGSWTLNNVHEIAQHWNSWNHAQNMQNLQYIEMLAILSSLGAARPCFIIYISTYTLIIDNTSDWLCPMMKVSVAFLLRRYCDG